MEGFNSLDLYQKSETLKQQSNYVLTLEMEDLVSNFIYGIAFIEQCFDEELRVVEVGVAPNGEMIKYLKKINLADVRYPTVV